MALAAGTRLGVYEIAALIGEGGMGEVYRARDLRLGRDVAVKILPPAFTADHDRLARFEREARVLASLNHPNIATIYGVENNDGVRAFVMELVEGPTLAERLTRGRLPMAEATSLARQIADALEAAHGRGIVHRDLKPANIKLAAASGTIKVLDFGLAKAVDGADLEVSQSPTAARDATEPGVVVGTAAYMSPEQARGQPVDKRTDIWAFGCVLYEMLTGRAAFGRSTLSDTLAAVLEREPDWSELLAPTPPAIRRVLHRCLEKDLKRRLHDIADARIEIDDANRSPAAVTTPARSWRAAAIGLGAIAIAAVGYIASTLTSRPDVGSPFERVRFAIQLEPGQQFPIDTGLPLVIALSPAGDQVVYSARTASGDRLYLRRRHDLEASSIAGTEGAIGPFFSPDGQSIGFAANGALKVMPLAGGAARTLADAPNFEGASWGPDGTIVYGPHWRSGLFKVSASGGPPEQLTRGDELHKSPHLLPDGKIALFSVARQGGIFVETVDTATGQRRTIVEGTNPVYLESGHIVFARGPALFAARFDPGRLEMTAPEVRVLDGVRGDGNDTHFTVARDGTLAYVAAASANSRLLWFDRQGHTRALDGEPRRYLHPRVSPDGSRVMVTLQRESGGQEIWIYDVTRGTRVRLAPNGNVSRPIWMADGKRIMFQHRGGLYVAPIDDSAAPELVLDRKDPTTSLFPLAWSTDGRLLAFSYPHPVTNRDVWVRRDGGSDTPILATPRDERAAMFSPDARWIVYAAKETGREEQIYVQPYPGAGGRVVVSPGGGIEPVWSPTGREIFFRSVDGSSVMAVNVRTEPSVTVGTPRLLFSARLLEPGGSYWSNYDVSRDGQQLLMLEAEQPSTPRVNVVLNWAAELK